MQRQIIMQANKVVRRTRPLLNTDDICNTYYNNGTLEIGFLSKQCKNDKKGSCLMCDYGSTNCSFSTKEYADKMKEILNKKYVEQNNLLLCTNGSIFDPHQVSFSTLEKIIKIASHSTFDKITFETHYLDVNNEVLNLIKQYSSNKEIIIEMGLESINQRYQDEIILKNIKLDKYEKTIKLIQSYGFTVEVNIMVGLPFLSQYEQYTYALEAIDWALKRNCLVTVFPINIKPFTLLRVAHTNGLYEPISHWLLITVLNDVNANSLNKLTVAWYGNRIEEYEGHENETIFPTSCIECSGLINKFYTEFNHTNDDYEKFTKVLQDGTLSYLSDTYKKCRCSWENHSTSRSTTYLSNTIRDGKRNYICDDCHKEIGQFSSYTNARAANWAITRNRKNCYCPKCAPRHRNVGCYGSVRIVY